MYLPIKPLVVVKVMSVLLTSIVMTWRRHDSILERYCDTEMASNNVISIFQASTRTSRQCMIPDEPFHRLFVLPRLLAQLQSRLHSNLLLRAHVLHGGDPLHAKLWKRRKRHNVSAFPALRVLIAAYLRWTIFYNPTMSYTSLCSPFACLKSLANVILDASNCDAVVL